MVRTLLTVHQSRLNRMQSPPCSNNLRPTHPKPGPSESKFSLALTRAAVILCLRPKWRVNMASSLIHPSIHKYLCLASRQAVARWWTRDALSSILCPSSWLGFFMSRQLELPVNESTNTMHCNDVRFPLFCNCLMLPTATTGLEL